jgi:hypothetical protein
MAKLSKPVTMTIPARIEELLEEYASLDERAEELIAEHIAAVKAAAPSQPLAVLRNIEIDNRAQGYSYASALRVLRGRLTGASETQLADQERP